MGWFWKTVQLRTINLHASEEREGNSLRLGKAIPFPQKAG